MDDGATLNEIASTIVGNPQMSEKSAVRLVVKRRIDAGTLELRNAQFESVVSRMQRKWPQCREQLLADFRNNHSENPFEQLIKLGLALAIGMEMLQRKIAPALNVFIEMMRKAAASPDVQSLFMTLAALRDEQADIPMIESRRA